MKMESHVHAIGVHGLANQELVVLEVANDLLGKALSTLLEFLDLILAGALLGKTLLDLLHVGWRNFSNALRGKCGDSVSHS